MTVTRTIAEARSARKELGRVALVPTMGALHAGHLSLIQQARSRADHVAVSIFVNPTQFGAREDFSKYPRPIETDLAACETAGVEMVFNPDPAEMYRPGEAAAVVDVPPLTETLEGKHRPGHFRGVCTVVAKLFNILTPDVALFGQKDFQQLRVLSAMTAAMDFPIEIVGCPTLREPDGLAMSSRNAYLSADERERALALSRGLFLARDEFLRGAVQTNRLVTILQKALLDPGRLGKIHLSIDYTACVDAQTLTPAMNVDRPVVLAVAVRVGQTRLIDNIILMPN